MDRAVGWAYNPAMRSTRIEGADPKPLGAPRDWSEETHGHCGALFIRREKVDGMPFMRSSWEADAEESLRFLAGGTLHLGIQGTCHPVVQVGPGTLPEDFEPVMQGRRLIDPEGRPYVRVEMLFAYQGGRRAYAENYMKDGQFADTVARCVDQIEQLARAKGWIE